MPPLSNEDNNADLRECKCYKVISSTPLKNKVDVFDMMQSFLQNEKKRLSEQDITKSSDDMVREKASWNELRKWANIVLEESNEELQNRIDDAVHPQPIEEWATLHGRRQRTDDDDDEEETEGYSDEENDDQEQSNEHRRIGPRIKQEAMEEEELTSMTTATNRAISDQLVKAETVESTGRAEVAIRGRSADEIFEDHVQSELEDIEEARKEMESKEAKRARKRERKQAKKDSKKKAKKEKKSKKRKRDVSEDVNIKVEEEVEY